MQDSKQLIREALFKQLNEKPYGKITVSHICTEAGVSRRTFYKHFAGVDDIVLAQLDEDFLYPVLNLRKLLPMDEIKSSATLMLERLCTTLYEKKDLYRKLEHYRGRNSLLEAINEKMIRLNLELYENTIDDDEEREIAAYFCSVGCNGLLIRWITTDNTIDPKHMAKYLNDWVFAHWREINSEKEYS